MPIVVVLPAPRLGRPRVTPPRRRPALASSPAAVLPEQRGDLPLVQGEGESVEGDHRLWLGGEGAREADEAHGLACALGRRAALLHRGTFWRAVGGEA